MNREQLEQNQIPIYFAIVIAAGVGGLLVPEQAHWLEVLVTPAIAVLMYAMFLQIPFLELREGFADKRFMVALLATNFLVIPCLVWGLTRGLDDHPAIMTGALLVLLTPCIDYVVVFTHIGKGDSKLTLAATPLLLLLQLVLLPLYLALMLDSGLSFKIPLGPFVEAFMLLIVAPLALAVLTSAVAKRSGIVEVWNQAWAWMPVPAMAAVLVVVICSQIGFVVSQFDNLARVIPVYIGFMILAPIAGALISKVFTLPTRPARSVVFSAATRNSLVVLPLALALPETMRGLAAAAVVTQTLIELVSELIYIRTIPFFMRDRPTSRV